MGSQFTTAEPDVVTTVSPHTTTAKSQITTPGPDVTTTEVSSTTAEPDVVTTVSPHTTTAKPQVTTPVPDVTTTTKVPLINCENGGRPSPNGKDCICPPGFSGTTCRTIETQIVAPEKLNRSADIQMDISEPFIEEYKNKSSQEYKKFSDDFKNRMEPFYRSKINNFKAVVNITFSQGRATLRSEVSDLKGNQKRLTEADTSDLVVLVDIYNKPYSNIRAEIFGVKVDHVVLLEIPNSQSGNKEYDNSINELKESLEEAKNCQTNDSSCPGYIITDVNTTTVEVDGTAFCEQNVPEKFLKYYQLLNTSEKLTCVSVCNPQHSDPTICKNKGTCMLPVEGPECHCLQTGTMWYLGSDCGIPINKAGLFVGTGMLAAAVLVAIGVLSVYLHVSKKKERRNRDNKGETINQWLEDEFEWPSSDKNTNGYTGIFHNPYNTEGGEGTYQQEKTPTYNPYPSFQTSDAPPVFLTHEPQIHLYNMPGSPMRIGRPDIYTSSQI
ncbi:mucin-3A [Anguilla anguilla]|uniref:mucin-3A n=1 Tax=Anguilla anguilla TaxID=7936 RepID=UPI0015ACA4C8|nr:mucin-3A [Anguilla anguilla]